LAQKESSQKGEVMAKKTDPCWDGYTQVGMKMKNGKKVPNCVPAKGVPKSKPKKKAGKK
jgi:hypothetical protein